MPVHYQIVGRSAAAISASIEAGVRCGALPPGASLPPVRTLAAGLGVAAATVASAYKGLRQRGVVETAGRNGTRIRARPPVAVDQIDIRHLDGGQLTTRWGPTGPVAPAFLANEVNSLTPGQVIDLASGEPDPSLLPSLGPRLGRLAADVGAVCYRDSGLMAELASQARARLDADGVPMRQAALTVTAGALDAIERLLTVMLSPGDRVGVEDPGWANLIDLIAALGMHAVAVPVDPEGPTVDGLRRAIAAGISAVIVTSRAHNPTGAAVSAGRAAALRRVLAGEPDLLVIEDDHAAELADSPLATVAASGARWAFVRSVSKPYGPDLRLAMVAGDSMSIARVEGRMRLGAGWVSTMLQRLVLQLWADESVAATVATARDEYARRRTALVAALARRGLVAYGGSGINVWISVTDEVTVVAALREHGYLVSPGSRHRLASPPGIRVTIAALDPSKVDEVADALASCVNGGSPRLGR